MFKQFFLLSIFAFLTNSIQFDRKFNSDANQIATLDENKNMNVELVSLSGNIMQTVNYSLKNSFFDSALQLFSIDRLNY